MRRHVLRTLDDVKTFGTVDWFSDHKGYGYLTADDGVAVFVQHTDIVGEGYRTLDAGDRVAFVVGDDGRGPTALEVTPAGAQDSTAAE